MKYILTAISALLLAATSLSAQTIFETVLSEIETNNTTLQAYKQQTEAVKLDNKTGLFLSNPEVGFNYLWGKPGAIGKRHDFSISQSFDFPTAYGFKNQIAGLKNLNADIHYKIQRQNILLEAKLICIDLIHLNAKRVELTKRLSNAENLAIAHTKMFDNGETSILELNKVLLHLTTIKNEIVFFDTERSSLLSELERLNGGQTLAITENTFPVFLLPESFEEWFLQVKNSNPLLQYAQQQISINQKQEKLNHALSLPKFSAGYMSEKVVGEKFSGISLGISIPLSENKNTVKAAKAQTTASKAIAVDAQKQIYNQQKSYFIKTTGLQKILNNYRQSLINLDNRKELKIALDKGVLPLINYLIEIQFYYETIDKMLETEVDLQKNLAWLKQWE